MLLCPRTFSENIVTAHQRTVNFKEIEELKLLKEMK